MSAKIKNATDWNTRDLRRLVHAVCDARRLHRNRTVSFVCQRRGTSRLGWAYYHSTYMRVMLPRDGEGLSSRTEKVSGVIDGPTLQSVANTIAHELDHNEGKKHRDMPRSYGLVLPWGELAVRAKAVKPLASKDELRARRSAAAEESIRERLARWESKQKRAQRAITKLKRSLRYYETRRAAQSATHPDEKEAKP